MTIEQSGRSSEDTTPEGSVLAARTAARLSKTLEVTLTDIGLSLPQYRLLSFLSRSPERATALAGSLDVSPPSLTALVDGCVTRGLVERVASPEDRRAVRHEITAAGHRVLAQADEALAARLEEIAGYLPAAQGRKIIEGLELLWTAMETARAARQQETATVR